MKTSMDQPVQLDVTAEPASHVTCSVCHREIPVPAAVWREGSDYVAHFCGLECYDQWRMQPGG
jgi:Domain of unknown function (DUF3330)